MPNIGEYHPAIVHFAIALVVMGVIFRWMSRSGRAAWAGPAAATLLLVGTAAAALAVHSGLDAHGPVERIPGARQAVVDHEDAGIWARNLFMCVALLELVALTARRRYLNIARGALWGSAIIACSGSARCTRRAPAAGIWCPVTRGPSPFGTAPPPTSPDSTSPRSTRRHNRPARNTTAPERRSFSPTSRGNFPPIRTYGCSRSSR